MNVQYYPVMDELSPSQWIAECAERLHVRWHSVDAAQPEEVAVELWRDAILRALPPAEAAARWLRRVDSPAPQ